MYTNNKLNKAVRLAIAFGAASATAFTASVTAGKKMNPLKLNASKLPVRALSVPI